MTEKQVKEMGGPDECSVEKLGRSGYIIFGSQCRTEMQGLCSKIGKNFTTEQSIEPRTLLSLCN